MMNLKNKVVLSIIIPAYNAKDTIDVTLSSIKKQILPISFEVILVNDCSKYSYKEFIDKYKKYYNIREVKTRKKSGPGLSRQYGIDISRSEYIIFIDSDDCFFDENSIINIYNEINKNNLDLVIANFVYQKYNIEEVKKQSFSWLHGKIYKRTFLEKNNIKFNDTLLNEDNGFNRLVLFLKPKYSFFDHIVYIYKENPNSITRKDSQEYKFSGIESFCYNMNWAMDEALKRGVEHKEIYDFSLEILITLYEYYLVLYDDYDVNQIFKWGKTIKDKFSKYGELFYEINEIPKKRILEIEKKLKKNYNIYFQTFLNNF